jgi:hypothetical protein
MVVSAHDDPGWRGPGTRYLSRAAYRDRLDGHIGDRDRRVHCGHHLSDHGETATGGGPQPRRFEGRPSWRSEWNRLAGLFVKPRYPIPDLRYCEGGLGRLDGTQDAFVYDRPLLAWYAHNEFGDSIDVLDVEFDKQSYAIAIPNDSPLRVPINLALLRLIDSPWWDDVTAKYLGKE